MNATKLQQLLKRLSVVLVIFTLFLCGAQAASAATIRSAVSATTTTGIPQAGALSQLSDQSGLSAGFTSGVTNFDTYLAGTPLHALSLGSTTWITASGVLTGLIDFDLGGPFAVDRLAIWQFAGNNIVGVNGLTLFSSLTSNFAVATNLGSFNLAIVPSNSSKAAQILSFSSTTAQFIRLQITSNYGHPFGTGLDEVAFSTNAAVPEPSTLLLLGTGLIGLAAYRRKRKV